MVIFNKIPRKLETLRVLKEEQINYVLGSYNYVMLSSDRDYNPRILDWCILETYFF